MDLPLQPTLENALIRLRPLRPDDFEALYAVAADPLVWEQHPNPTRYQREVFETYFAGAIESGGAFLVQDAATGAAIGSSRFYEYDPAAGSVLIGYTFLGRDHWGGPTNRALKQLMLDHAFQFVDDVLFTVGAGNRRSQRAMEKLGAEKVDERGVAYHGEREVPNYVYRIRRADWLARPHAPAQQPTRPPSPAAPSLMILIAGPYRSGTGDDPAKLDANVAAMEAYALPLFRAGHIPVVGEWFALPLVRLAGSRQIGDAAFTEVFHPIAEQLLARCDAVMRMGGPSQGADLMVQVARERGLAVFTSLQQVPGCEGAPEPAG